MFRTCLNPPVPCLDPAEPIANLSSESPDPIDYISRSYGDWQNPPRLGNPWFTAYGCEQTCISTESADAAAACAELLRLSCEGENDPDVVPPEVLPPGFVVPPLPPDAVVNPRTPIPNTPQTATATCPDGSESSYTTPAGRFHAWTQAQADARALAYAQIMARTVLICIGSLSDDGCCAGVPVVITFPVSGGASSEFGYPIYTQEVTSGSLPPGMELLQITPTRFSTFGVCETPGSYTFTVTITDTSGNARSKSFTIGVFGITNASTLPSGDVGTPYSVQLTADGGVEPYTFSLLSGSLPDGLSLSASGLISGTPTTDEIQDFTVEVEDDS